MALTPAQQKNVSQAPAAQQASLTSLYESENLPSQGATVPTVTPAVITSGAANTDLNNIKTNLNDVKTGIATQTAKVTANKAVTDAKATTDAQTKAVQDKNTQDYNLKLAALNGTDGNTPPPVQASPGIVGTTITSPTTTKSGQVASDVLQPDGTRLVTYADGNTDIFTVQKNADGSESYIDNAGNVVTTTGATDGSPDVSNPSQDAADKLSQDMFQKATDTYNQILGIQNGSIPFSAGEQAQIDNLKAQFQQLITQQQTANANYEGSIVRSGIAAGRDRYAPEIQSGIIYNSIQQGIAKIADLNSKMSSAIYTLEQGFKDNDIKAIQSANNAYQDAAKSRADYLQKIADKTEALNKITIQATRDSTIASLIQQGITDPTEMLNLLNFDDNGNRTGDFTAKEVTDTITQLTPDAKNVFDILKTVAGNGAPKDIIANVGKAKSVAEAISAAGDYLQNGTGIVGEYQYYKREAEAAGKKPVDFNTYQTIDANRKAAAANAGKPTATQITYANYAPRLETADDTINSLTDTISKLPLTSFLFQQNLPSALQSSNIQSYNQAKSNFVNAVLRQESGASISDAERAAYDKQYFPQPGDSQTVIDQKSQNRAQVVSSYRNAAGVAYVPPIGKVIQKTEDTAKGAVTDYGTSHPDARNKIKQMISDGKSYSDVQQIMGI